jgi:hypothetical protein
LKKATTCIFIQLILLIHSSGFAAIKLPSPIIIPGDTIFVGHMVTHISIPDSSIVYYSLNGSVPNYNSNPSSMFYAPGFTISIDSELTLNAIAFPKNGLDTSLLISDMASVKYTKRLTPPYLSDTNGYDIYNYFQDSIIIALKCFEGASVYYSLDTTAPTTNSAKYTIPLTFKQSVHIKAIAAKTGRLTSTVANIFLFNIAQNKVVYIKKKQAIINYDHAKAYYLINGQKTKKLIKRKTNQIIINGK